VKRYGVSTRENRLVPFSFRTIVINEAVRLNRQHN
jgi:hypothetical protein